MSKTNNTLRITLILLLIILLVVLASVILLSTYTRFFTDDFCEASAASKTSFFEYMKLRYTGWTGRFSFTFLSGFISLLGWKAPSVFSAVIIFLWFVSLMFAMYQVLTIIGHPFTMLSAAMYASLILVFLFSSLPALYESVFWLIGSINYSLPLIIFSLLAGFYLLIGRNKSKRIYSFLLPLLAFINCGFSEIFSVIQVAIFSIVILFLYKNGYSKKNKALMQSLLIGFIFSLAALFIVWIAPGNAVRQAASSHPNPTSMVELPWVIVRSTLVIFYVFLVNSKGWVLLLLLVPFLLGLLIEPGFSVSFDKSKSLKDILSQKPFRTIVAIALFVLIISLVAATPSSYIQGEYPENRAMILPFFFIDAGIMAIMAITGSMVRNHLKDGSRINISSLTLVACILLVIFTLFRGVSFSGGLLKDLPAHVTYAQTWDARDESLRLMKSQGVQHAVTRSAINGFGYGDLTSNPKNWVNRCMADYYGFSSISVE